MKTLDSLNLIVPKLGRDAARKITGGMDGGYIQPSYCYGGSGSLSWDSWYYDYLFNHYDPDYGENHDGGGGADYEGSYNDYDDSDDLSNITFGDNIDESIKEQIKNLIQNLPEELQNQEIKILIDSDLLKECSKSDNYSGIDNAAFLYASHHLNSYGTDIIILRDEDHIPALFEELLHSWQYNNSLDGESKIANADLSAMEFQAAIIEAIDVLYNNPYNSDTLPIGLGEIIGNIYNGFTDPENSSFDINLFLSSISDEEWKSYYEEWGQNGGYGIVNENYDWKWNEILEIVFGNGASDVNHSSNPY